MTQTLARREARAAESAFARLRPLTGPFNRIAVRLAGTRALPFFSIVRHRGRRSGRTFATPVAARRTSSGFAIPLAYGEEADWCRNLRAAGGGVIRWSGREYPVTAPELADI